MFTVTKEETQEHERHRNTKPQSQNSQHGSEWDLKCRKFQDLNANTPKSKDVYKISLANTMVHAHISLSNEIKVFLSLFEAMTKYNLSRFPNKFVYICKHGSCMNVSRKETTLRD